MDEPRIERRRRDLPAATKARLQKRIRGEIPSKVSIAKISRRSDRSIAPLSFAQEGQWLLEQLHPGSSVFNVCQVMRIPGKLDKQVLERSLSEVVRRHDILRTSFRAIGGPPMQLISPPQQATVEWVDMTNLPGAQDAA